ncbi:MAG: hypothetical protein FJ102_19515 [Deltaproteobacteria bacterium]|nr:hypothetical protein [Deltaproteobacteria bacterium]
MRLGRSDLPFSPDGDQADQLGLDTYARALASFVRNCDTPMTIGIQGEWGSGKTSLMNMVRGALRHREGERAGVIHLHTFETWQYGALGDDDTLGLQLISTLADQVVREHEDNGAVVRTGSWLRDIGQRLSQPSMTRAVAAGVVGLVPGVDGGEMVSALGQRLAGQAAPPQAAAAGLQNLRTMFATMVGTVAIPKDGKPKAPPGRFVIFVDDLDRIRPERAVTLLEVLKNFLDVQHCVFVIACDYEVVRLGVEGKFGIRDPEKVRAFFDKIIQVPFRMPTHRYEVRGLLADYLEGKITPRAKAASLAKELAPMVQIATGTNPRGFKRFLNVLDLMSCVRASDGPDAGSSGGREQVWGDPLAAASLAGLVAMQTRWPTVADYVSNIKDAVELGEVLTRLRELGENPDPDAPADDEDTLITLLRDAHPAPKDGVWTQNREIEQLSEFVDLLCGLLGAESVVDPKRLDHLLSWATGLSLTRVAPTSTEGSEVTPGSTGRDRFIAAVQKKDPNAAGRFLDLVDRIALRRRGNARWIGQLNHGQSHSTLNVFMTISGKTPTILSLSQALRITLVSGAYSAPTRCGGEILGLAALGDKFVAESVKLGVGWERLPVPGQGWYLAFGAARFDSDARFTAWCGLIFDLLDKVADAVVAETARRAASSTATAAPVHP